MKHTLYSIGCEAKLYNNASLQRHIYIAEEIKKYIFCLCDFYWIYWFTVQLQIFFPFSLFFCHPAEETEKKNLQMLQLFEFHVRTPDVCSCMIVRGQRIMLIWIIHQQYWNMLIMHNLGIWMDLLCRADLLLVLFSILINF